METEKDVYIYAAEYGNRHLGCQFSGYAKLKIIYMNTPPGKLPMPRHSSEFAIAYEREEQLYAIAPHEEWVKKINWSKMEEMLFDSKMRNTDKSMGWSEVVQGTQKGIFG